MTTSNVPILLCTGALLCVIGFSGACRDTPPPPPDNSASEAAYQRRTEAANLERCLPFTCTVEAVRVADTYVGACTEQWREQREIRAAQRARGIPDEAP